MEAAILIASVIVSVPLWLCVYGLDLIQRKLNGIANNLDDIDNQMRRTGP